MHLSKQYDIANTTAFISLVILSSIIIPFGTHIYIMFPIRIFEKNIWTALPLILSVVVWLYSIYLRGFILSRLEKMFFFLTAVLIVILYFRNYLYRENQSLLSSRWVISPFIYVFFMYFAVNNGLERAITKSMILGAVLVASIIYVNRLLMPEVGVYIDQLTREPVLLFHGPSRDGVMGASLSDHLILIPVFLILYELSKNRISSIDATIVASYIVGASLFSNTRLVAMFAVVLCGMLVFELLKINRMRLAIGLLFLVPASLWIIMTLIYNSRWQTEGDGGRYYKYINGLESIFFSFESAIIGVAQNSYSYKNGFTFSDNGFIQLAYSFGVPVFLLYLSLFVVVIRGGVPGFYGVMILVYGATTIFFTNAITWENWMIYLLAAFILVRQRGQVGSSLVQ